MRIWTSVCNLRIINVIIIIIIIVIKLIEASIQAKWNIPSFLTQHPQSPLHGFESIKIQHHQPLEFDVFGVVFGLCSVWIPTD